MLGNFLDIVDDALERHISLVVPLQIALLRLPMGLKELGAVTVLISVMLFLAVSSQNLEPVVLRSLGIRSRVMLKPLLVQGGVISFLLFINAAFIAPSFYSKSRDVYLEKIKGQPRKARISPVDIWLKEKGYFCNVGFF